MTFHLLGLHYLLQEKTQSILYHFSKEVEILALWIVVQIYLSYMCRYRLNLTVQPVNLPITILLLSQILLKLFLLFPFYLSKIFFFSRQLQKVAFSAAVAFSSGDEVFFPLVLFHLKQVLLFLKFSWPVS